MFHLAAQPLVRESYRDPLGTFASNVTGTANVLEAARTSDSARAIVVITTVKVYENREWVYPYREVDPLGGIHRLAGLQNVELPGPAVEADDGRARFLAQG